MAVACVMSIGSSLTKTSRTQWQLLTRVRQCTIVFEMDSEILFKSFDCLLHKYHFSFSGARNSANMLDRDKFYYATLMSSLGVASNKFLQVFKKERDRFSILHEFMKTCGNITPDGDLEDQMLPSLKAWGRLFLSMKAPSELDNLYYNIWGYNFIYRRTRVDPNQHMPRVIRDVAPGAAFMTQFQLAINQHEQRLRDARSNVEQNRRDREYEAAVQVQRALITGLLGEEALGYEEEDEDVLEEDTDEEDEALNLESDEISAIVSEAKFGLWKGRIRAMKKMGQTFKVGSTQKEIAIIIFHKLGREWRDTILLRDEGHEEIGE